MNKVYFDLKCRFTGQPALFWVSSYMSMWSNILFNCAVLINLIVAFFYPFVDQVPSKCSHLTFKIGNTGPETGCGRICWGWLLWKKYIKLRKTSFKCVLTVDRTWASPIRADLGGDARLCCHSDHAAKRVWYPDPGRVHDTAHDLLRRTWTYTVAAGHSHGMITFNSMKYL